MNDERSSGTTRRALLGVVSMGAVTVAGCSETSLMDSTETEASETSANDTGTATNVTLQTATETETFGYTHRRASGNRVVGGQGRLPDVDAVDVDVSWTPAWVVGVPTAEEDGGSHWSLVGEQGEVVGVQVRDGETSMTEISPAELPGGLPPLLRAGRPPTLVTPPADADEAEATSDPAEITHPVPVALGGSDGADDESSASDDESSASDDEGLLFVSTVGDLVLWNDGEEDRLELDALPDARIVTADGRAFVFADATTRYGHAVLGDSVEAGSVAVVDYAGDSSESDAGLSEVARIRPDPEDRAVFEGLAPIVADLNGDGTREVLVTESGGGNGARLVAFDTEGERLATGPVLGSGWRHQIAVAPFAPDGRAEIGVIQKPHVGQTAEFYRLEDGDLRIVGEAQGYSSHSIGSRNLDGGLAGDVDGDGRVELLVPTVGYQSLGAVRRTQSGAKGVWEVALGGPLTTNIGAVASGGRVTVAAGWNGTVRFWPG